MSSLLVRTSISAALGLVPASAWAQEPDPVPAPAPPPATPAAPTEPPPPTDVPAPSSAAVDIPPSDVAGDDEYVQLLRELPPDYDINYRFVAPPVRRGRVAAAPAQPGDAGTGNTNVSRDAAKRMRVAGGSVLAAGLVTFGVSLGLGLGGVGEKDGALWMMAGVPIGTVMTISGGTLVGVGRKASRAHGDLPPRSAKPQLTDKQRKNNIFAASFGWLFGAIGVGAGAAILAKGDDDGVKSGSALLAVGVVSVGIATYSTIRLAVNKSRRTIVLAPAPLYVRGGGGTALTMRF